MNRSNVKKFKLRAEEEYTDTPETPFLLKKGWGFGDGRPRNERDYETLKALSEAMKNEP